MKNITAFKNTIKEIEVDEYVFKIDQLTVFELYSKAQEEYKKFILADSMMIAECLTGKDKVDFLKDVLKEFPTGEDLAIELQNYIQSADGTIMLLKFIISKNNPELLENEISKIVSPATIDKYLPLYNYALSGMETDSEDTQSNPMEEAKKKKLQN